jgi:hypothetical protein
MTDIMTLGNSTLANDLKLPPQAKTVLRHLEKGKTISPLQAWMVYGIYRLSDCIFKIRNAGHDVTTHECMDERGRKYADYQLNTRLTLN